MAVKRIIVLASGRGSNFAAIALAIQKKKLTNAKIIALFTNNPAAPAIEIARQHKIPVLAISQSAARDADDRALCAQLKTLEFDFIVLAGYLRVIGPQVLAAFAHQMINIHPSLLPSFKGLKAQQQALDYGVGWTGCTVHFVSAEVDNGTIIGQSILKLKATDTAESLAQRLLPLEHKLYLRSLQKLVTTPYRIQGRRLVWEKPAKKPISPKRNKGPSPKAKLLKVKQSPRSLRK